MKDNQIQYIGEEISKKNNNKNSNSNNIKEEEISQYSHSKSASYESTRNKYEYINKEYLMNINFEKDDDGKSLYHIYY